MTVTDRDAVQYISLSMSIYDTIEARAAFCANAKLFVLPASFLCFVLGLSYLVVLTNHPIMAEPDYAQYMSQRFAINAELRQQLIFQGLGNWTSIRNSSESDITDAASAIRSPGGTIANPLRALYDQAVLLFENHDPGPDDANPIPNPHFRPNPPGPAPTISNPGYLISHQTVTHLKHLSYYLKHLARTSRPFVNAGSTEARLAFVYHFKQVEDNYDVDEGPRAPVKMDKVSRIQEIIEEMEEYLSAHRGHTGVILSYLIREDDNPMVGYAYTDTAADVFESFDQEMILRGPLTGHAFNIDNKRLWQLWYTVLHDTESYSWISQHARRQDGRAAHSSVKTHYLGEGHHQRTRTRADAVVESLFYTGEKPNFTFETYCSKLKRAHGQLSDAEEPVPEDKKVRKMLSGIRDRRLLQGPIPTVKATPSLLHDFDKACTYLTTFVAENTATNSRNVSSLYQGRGGRGRGGRGHNPYGGRGGRGGRSDGRGFTRGGGRWNNNQGRGGRGRSGGRGYGPRDAGNGVRNVDLHTGDYDSHTWQNVLTATQRGRVMAMREAEQTRQAAAASTTVPPPPPAGAPVPPPGVPPATPSVSDTMTRRGGR